MLSDWAHILTLVFALALCSAEQPVHHSMGHVVSLYKSGDYQKAAVAAKLVLADEPFNAAMHVVLGHLYTQLKQHSAAQRSYQQGITVLTEKAKTKRLSARDRQDLAAARTWVAVRLRRQGDKKGGVKMLKQAIKDDPKGGEAYYQLGFAYLELGRLKNALRYSVKTLKLKISETDHGMSHTPAYLTILEVLAGARRWKEIARVAGLCLLMCKLEEESDELALRVRLSAALEATKKHSQAVKAHRKMTEMFSEDAIEKEMMYFRGVVQQGARELKRRNLMHNAETWMRKYVAAIPAAHGWDIELRSIRQCQWAREAGDLSLPSAMDELSDIYGQYIDDGTVPHRFQQNMLHPLSCLLMPNLPATMCKFVAHIAAMKTHKELEGHRLEIRRSDYTWHASSKLRVAVYTADATIEHPMLRITRAFVSHATRYNVQFILYTIGASASVLDQFRSHVVKAVDITNMADEDASKAIHRELPHVLIDMTGRTSSGRPAIVSNKAAPVVAAWGGFPGTSGDPSVDYLIADARNAPLSLAHQYSEKLIHLPGTWLLNDHRTDFANIDLRRAREQHKRDARRLSFGLPLSSEGVVFANFNRPTKFDSVTFQAWCTIVRRVPNSVLLLVDMGKTELVTRRNLQQWWTKQCNLPSKRLVFMKSQLVGEHIRAWTVADLILDTGSFNGGMTTVDALFAGVPHLTLSSGLRYSGKFPELMGSGLLQAAGLADCIMPDIVAYIDRATELGTNPLLLEALTQRTIAASDSKKPSKLFDPDAGARHVVWGLRKAFERWYSQQEADHITVPDT